MQAWLSRRKTGPPCLYGHEGQPTLYLVIKFHLSKKLGKLGRVFATTKGLGHGLGLSRIENIVEKHDGYLSFNSEDGAFTAEILLPQE